MKAIYNLIKLNRAIQNHRIKFGAVFLANVFSFRHLFLRFDPVMACNLSCTMCYFSNDDYRKNTKGIFKEEEIEQIARMLFPLSVQVVYGCGTEPTLYKNFPALVQLAKRYKVPYVGFTSNGQLLTEQHFERFVEDGLDELILSVHGVKKETYERFMAGSSYEKFHQVLSMLEEVKKKRSSSKPHLRLNYTVNRDNLEELANFFDVFGRYSITTLQVRPIMDMSGVYRTVLDENDVPRYEKTLQGLRKECAERGITLLANVSDPRFEQVNVSSVILQAVRRYVSPDVVWRKDFNWRTETYTEFCQRIRWNQYLLKCVFSSLEKVMEQNSGFWGKYSTKYDVFA